MAWMVATFALLGPLIFSVMASGRGSPAQRMVATQMASAIGILLSIGLSFATDQPSAIDLALALALLTFPATLLFALFQERWL
jgi:multisubunit Na+/H+ antiporter MnhF subunit